MKRSTPAALVLSLMTLGVPAAHASHTYVGGCRFAVTTDPTGLIAQSDVFTGILYAEVVITSPAGGFASVLCEIQVNGVTKEMATFTGTGAVVGAEDAQFLAGAEDFVSVRETVTVDGHSSTECGDPSGN